MIFFSVITINLNNHLGLQKTISSVIEQTFNSYELIVVDGASTDKSIEVIKTFEKNITCWSSEKDNGIYDAQNKGILKAKGEYILFLNSGDFLSSNYVLQKVYDSKPVEDIVYGDIIIHKNGSTERKKYFPDTLSNYFLITDVIGHQSQFIKRNLFECYGVYNTQYKIVADYEFFIRMLFKHKISTKHLQVFVSVFDLSGLSSKKEEILSINSERHKIQKIYFPKALVFIYHTYAAILQSKIYKIPIVAMLVKLIRDLIFKFIKPAK